MLIRDRERELAVIRQVVKDAPRVPLLFVGVIRGLEIVRADTCCFPGIVCLFTHKTIIPETSETQFHGIAIKRLEIVHPSLETGTADAAQLLNDDFLIGGKGEDITKLCIALWMTTSSV